MLDIDYFNDYRTTRAWAIQNQPELVPQLDEGWKEYQAKRWAPKSEAELIEIFNKLETRWINKDPNRPFSEYANFAKALFKNQFIELHETPFSVCVILNYKIAIIQGGTLK